MSKTKKTTDQKSTSRTDALSNVRLDKWLQVARIYKTRSQAGEALDAGHVKMDGRRAKASHVVKPGEVIEVVKGPRRLTLTVIGVAPKPIPAAEARELYTVREEHEKLEGLSPEQQETMRMMKLMDRASQTSRKGRPTKKDRRDLERKR